MSNGYLRPDELEVVEDDDQLNHMTARAFYAARSAYYAEGGSGSCIVERAGAYRSYSVQYGMKHGIPSYAYWNLNPANKAGLATPGTTTHGLGDTLDAAPGFQGFLLRRGAEFGFYRPFGDRDPNHWRHNGVAYAGGSATLIRKTTMEDDGMLRLIKRNNAWWAIVITPISILEINSATDLQEYYASYAIWGDGSQPPAEMEPATDIDITEDQLRIEYVQLAKRIASFKAALGGGSAGVTDLTPVLTAIAAGETQDAKDQQQLLTAIAALPAAVITEQKKPGN